MNDAHGWRLPDADESECVACNRYFMPHPQDGMGECEDCVETVQAKVRTHGRPGPWPPAGSSEPDGRTCPTCGSDSRDKAVWAGGCRWPVGEWDPWHQFPTTEGQA